MKIRTATLVALAVAVSSCLDSGTTAPAAVAPQSPRLFTTTPPPAVRFAELHYDNVSTDVDERIEISAPAGTDLAGWQVVLYNGNSSQRSVYNTRTLDQVVPATCGSRGVIVLEYPVNGIQNGGSGTTATTDPDGMALVDASGVVIEFLSYEGVFVAANGPAAGLTSTDIGVRQNGDPIGMSLQRDAAGIWTSAEDTFGECNDAGEAPPPADVASVTVTPDGATISVGLEQIFSATAFDADGGEIAGAAIIWTSRNTDVASVDASGRATGVAPGEAWIVATAASDAADSALLVVDAAPPPPPLSSIRFSEIHYDNVNVDVGESIEIEGPAGASLAGWSVILYNGNGGGDYDTQSLSGVIPDLCGGRGVVVLEYPQNGIQNGSPDGMALINAANQVVEFLSYEGTFTATSGPAAGMLSVDIGVEQPASTPIGLSLQRAADGSWYGPSAQTFGACNGSGDPPPPPGGSISFSGRTVGDPPLPVGFQDQLFATVRDASGAVVQTPVIWSSETPAIASIDDRGVMTALAAGTAILRATTEDGTTSATYSLPTRIAVSSTSASYVGNAEFGEPTDGDPRDDFIIRRREYTASYNSTLGIPNWVSYNLEATHFGPEDRCDCFTFDPELPSSFQSYTTADYTGAGAYHGYGIDRGHLVRSFDRTAGSRDNATTYYFTNIIPQAADMNQGPWATMENHLGDLARFQNREVYIITGGAGSKGTIKDEGKITIPAWSWKVAVIMPRDQGLANVTDHRDLEVISVVMPNEPGIRNVNWETYRVTVDSVEALSGYDVLALLRNDIEIAVESGTHPPSAVLDGPYTSSEGSTVSLSAAASSDPDGHALTYHWSFGDGGVATGVSPTYTWAQDGEYVVRLIVRDILGLADTTETTATVANVAPSIAPFAGATLLPGESYGAQGSFTDPGADTWSATVDYGDGSGVRALALSGKQFTLAHTYTSTGTMTVTVRISDDDDTAVRTAIVTVLTPAQGLQSASAMVGQLVAAGTLNRGLGTSLESKLDAARRQLALENPGTAVQQLEAALQEIDALVRGGRVSAAALEPLRTMIERVIASIDS